ncbi:MAG: hypothetical protein ACI86C_001989, partial [Candidatus Latescibacterota bacterium]
KLLEYSISGTLKKKYEIATDSKGNQFVKADLAGAEKGFTGTLRVNAVVGYIASKSLAAPTDSATFDVALNTLVNDFQEASVAEPNGRDACLLKLKSFMSLAEKNDITSHPVVGFRSDEKKVGVNNAACWAEVYSAEKWVIFDVEYGELVREKADSYVGLRILDIADLNEEANLRSLMSDVYGVSATIKFGQ